MIEYLVDYTKREQEWVWCCMKSNCNPIFTVYVLKFQNADYDENLNAVSFSAIYDKRKKHLIDDLPF